MMVFDVETAWWGFWHGVYLVPVGPLSLQLESHTKQDEDFKKWLVLEVVCSTDTIGNELQYNCDRIHMVYNEEFILVTNCLCCHIVYGKFSHRKGDHPFWHLNHIGWFLTRWQCFPVICVLTVLVVLLPNQFMASSL